MLPSGYFLYGSQQPCEYRCIVRSRETVKGRSFCTTERDGTPTQVVKRNIFERGIRITA